MLVSNCAITLVGEMMRIMPMRSSVFLVPAFFIFFWILNFCFYMKVGAQSDYIVLQIKLRRRHALNVN